MNVIINTHRTLDNLGSISRGTRGTRDAALGRSMTALTPEERSEHHRKLSNRHGFYSGDAELHHFEPNNAMRLHEVASNLHNEAALLYDNGEHTRAARKGRQADELSAYILNHGPRISPEDDY